jgi:hypothetical protein
MNIDDAIQETENLNIDAGTISPTVQKSITLAKNMLKTIVEPEVQEVTTKAAQAPKRGAGGVATLME